MCAISVEDGDCNVLRLIIKRQVKLGINDFVVAWCLLLGACCLVLVAWCLLLVAWCLVLGAWCLVLVAWCFGNHARKAQTKPCKHEIYFCVVHFKHQALLCHKRGCGRVSNAQVHAKLKDPADVCAPNHTAQPSPDQPSQPDYAAINTTKQNAKCLFIVKCREAR